VWDLFLPASSPVAIWVEVLSGDLDLGVELFKSNGAEYYARRGQGVAVAGPGGLLYTTGGSSDFYGLVIHNAPTPAAAIASTSGTRRTCR